MSTLFSFVDDEQEAATALPPPPPPGTTAPEELMADVEPVGEGHQEKEADAATAEPKDEPAAEEMVED